MNDTQTLNKRYAVIAWGALSVLLGTLMIVPGDQGNLFIFMSGIVLLVLNLARSLGRLAVNPFSTTLGFLALGLGSLGLLWPVFDLPPFEISLVPLGLLALGLYLLIPGPRPAQPGQ